MGDFLEIMSFYGFDLEAADAHVKREYPETPNYTEDLMARIMEESCVDRVQP